MGQGIASVERARKSLLAVVAVILACDGPAAPGGGAVSVGAEATGATVLPKDIGVTVDGTPHALAPPARMIVSPLPQGTHEIVLNDVPVTCQVGESRTRRVEVREGDTTRVDFAITCEPPSGMLQLSIVSTGSELDPNGYEVVVDDSVRTRAPSVSQIVLGVPSGAHTLLLSQLTDNCTAEDNPRSVVVRPGAPINVHFAVSCKAAPAAGRGHELAFVTDRNASDIPSEYGDRVYLMNEDGTGLRALPTAGPVGYFDPAWSPDGHLLALAGVDGLYLLDPSAGEPSLIPDSQGLGEPAWSPDGTRIAFIRDQFGFQVWTVEPDGGNPIQISHESGLPGSPTWAPDGNRIAFVTSTTDEYEFTISRIVIQDVQSGVREEVFTVEGFLGDVAWSPDGHTLAFAGESPEDTNWRIRLLSLVDHSVRTITSGDSDLEPTWSPDGTRIAFTNWTDGEIYVVNADGTDPLPITDAPSEEGNPAWRP